MFFSLSAAFASFSVSFASSSVMRCCFCCMASCWAVFSCITASSWSLAFCCNDASSSSIRLSFSATLLSISICLLLCRLAIFSSKRVISVSLSDICSFISSCFVWAILFRRSFSFAISVSLPAMTVSFADNLSLYPCSVFKITVACSASCCL